MRRLWAVVIVVAGLLGGVSAAPAAAQVAPSLSTPELLDAARRQRSHRPSTGRPPPGTGFRRSGEPPGGVPQQRAVGRDSSPPGAARTPAQHAARTSTRPDPGSTRETAGSAETTATDADRTRLHLQLLHRGAAERRRPARTSTSPTPRSAAGSRSTTTSTSLESRRGRPRSTGSAGPRPRSSRRTRRPATATTSASTTSAAGSTGSCRAAAPTPAPSATTRRRRGTTSTPWRRAWSQPRLHRIPRLAATGDGLHHGPRVQPLDPVRLRRAQRHQRPRRPLHRGRRDVDGGRGPGRRRRQPQLPLAGVHPEPRRLRRIARTRRG